MKCELCVDDLVHEQIGGFAKDHGFCIEVNDFGHPYIRSAAWDVVAQLYTSEQVLCFLRQRWGDEIRLELGAGKKNKDGPPWGKYPWATIGLNQWADPNCDIYKDLNCSWADPNVCWDNPGKRKTIPFPGNCVAEIHANQFFEHIQYIIPLMNDCYRVLVPGGFMNINVPYYLGPDAWSDPTHVRAFSENSFRYFCRREDGAQFAEQFSDYGITAMFDLETNHHTNVGMSVVLRKPNE